MAVVFRKKSGSPVVSMLSLSGHVAEGGDNVNGAYYDWFEIKVDTTIPSFTNADQFAICQLDPAIVYDVGWGDSTTSVDQTATGEAAITHTYASGGIYRVRMVGRFNWRLYAFGPIANDRYKIIDCMRYGPLLEWRASEYLFPQANIVGAISATDAPLPSQVGGVRMFWQISGLTTGPENWTGVTGNTVPGPSNLLGCFQNCSSLTADVGHWDVTGNTSMSFTFRGCASWNHHLDWDMSDVTSFSSCFQSCPNFNDGNTPGVSGGGVGIGMDTWNMNKVSGLSQMFNAATQFNTYIGSWRPSSANATPNFTLNFAFSNAHSFNQDIGDWCDAGSNCNGLQQAFDTARAFNNNGVGGLNLGLDKWSTTGNTSLFGTFARCDVFDQYINSWDTSLVSDFRQCFYQALVFNQDVSQWIVSTGTLFSQMFQEAAAFNNGGVGSGVGTGLDNWTTSSATNMSSMFNGASSFNQYIGSWNMTGVTTISGMFKNATSFVDGGIGNWTFTTLNTVAYFCQGATNFNPSLDWDCSTVSNMDDFFYSADSFNGGQSAGSSGRNVLIIMPTSLFSANYLFGDCPSFNQDVSTGGGYFDMSQCTSMASMFRTGTSFDQPLSSWDTTNVENISNMFQNNGGAWDQDVSSWNISSLTNASNWCAQGFSRTNYDLLLDNTTGWASQATIQSSVSFSVGSTQYTLGGNAEAGHNYLTGIKMWNIVDGGGV